MTLHGSFALATTTCRRSARRPRRPDEAAVSASREPLSLDLWRCDPIRHVHASARDDAHRVRSRHHCTSTLRTTTARRTAARRRTSAALREDRRRSRRADHPRPTRAGTCGRAHDVGARKYVLASLDRVSRAWACIPSTSSIAPSAVCPRADRGDEPGRWRQPQQGKASSRHLGCTPEQTLQMAVRCAAHGICRC